MTSQDGPGYAQRIKQALKEGPNATMSVRELAKRIEELAKDRDVQVTSYGGIRLYVEGKVQNPRTETLEAIAEVLDVRRAWLISGEDPMTEAEAALQEELARRVKEGREELGDGQGAEDPKTPRAKQKQRLKEALRELIGGERPIPTEEIPYWVDGVLEVFKRAVASDFPRQSEADDVYFADVGAAILGPAEALGVDVETMRDLRGGTVWADYITTITPALLLLVAERERQSREGWKVAGRG